MWCPDCKSEFREVPGADVQVCPTCIAKSRAGKRKRRVPKLKRKQSTAKQSTPLLRIDDSHKPDPDLVPSFIPEKQRRQNRSGKKRSAKETGQTRSLKHIVIFGLFVFLAGQAAVIWAFLAGHFAAWSIGNLISILGLTISIASIAQTFQMMERKIDRLAILVAGQKKKKRKKKPAKSQT